MKVPLVARTVLAVVAASLCIPLLAAKVAEVAGAAKVAEDSVLMRAMRDELARSMEQLRLEDADAPYFLSYRVHETASGSARASLGGLLNVVDGFGRQLVVELRVGDYDFDNTNFASMSRSIGRLAVGGALSVDDDYDTLRRQMWLTTDTAYKRALDQLGAKRAGLQNQTQVEKVPDFSRETPHQYDGLTEGHLDTGPAQALALDVSRTMRGMPHLSRSEVRVATSFDRTWFVNSEGSAFVRETPYIGLHALAATQADDGAELEDLVSVWVSRWADMPDSATLKAEVQTMTARLEQRREAPYLERYTGPVLFEGQAAAELVTQVLGPRLIARRLPTPDDPQAEQYFERFRNPFLDRIGSRVLPRFLSVVCDPTLESHEGVPLRGRQLVDDDGLPARPTLLVERGILKALLSTRVPLAEVPNSTGSRRREAPVPSNLFVNPTRGLGDEELKEELFAVAADRGLDHALVVRRIGNRLAKLGSGYLRYLGSGGDGSSVEPLMEVYRVFPDGREERIRIANLSSISEADFKDIVAVSESTTRHDTGFSPTGGVGIPGLGGGRISPISVITPSLLFEDLTVKRPAGSIPNPPVMPHPLAKR